MNTTPKHMRRLLLIGLVLLDWPFLVMAREPTKASESLYNSNILLATTSEGLTNADLAWHAANTYGWNCSEVVSKGNPTKDGYFLITCSNGKKFRVYPRNGQHPRITNMKGGYD